MSTRSLAIVAAIGALLFVVLFVVGSPSSPPTPPTPATPAEDRHLRRQPPRRPAHRLLPVRLLGDALLLLLGALYG